MPNLSLSHDSITKKWALLTGICVFPLFVLFDYLGDPGRGQAACVSAMSVALAVRFVWHLRKHAWFWAVTVVIVLCHVPLVLFIPWPFKQLAYIALLPMCLLDFCIVYALFRLIENRWSGHQQ